MSSQHPPTILFVLGNYAHLCYCLCSSRSICFLFFFLHNFIWPLAHLLLFNVFSFTEYIHSFIPLLLHAILFHILFPTRYAVQFVRTRAE